MLSDPDFSSKLWRHTLACMVAGGLLAGCVAPAGTAQPSGSIRVKTTVAPAPLSPAPICVPQLPLPEFVTPILAYADQIRPLQGPDLAQEIARFTELSEPVDQMKLSIALAQTRQLYDLVRAQDLLQKVIANSGARALHPLARILAARFAEQRRVEDQLDRQGSQLRDAQRRLEQTNDKLDALKEIERSLTGRTGASPPAPSPTRNRSRAVSP
jgi:hypothetical protein